MLFVLLDAVETNISANRQKQLYGDKEEKVKKESNNNLKARKSYAIMIDNFAKILRLDLNIFFSFVQRISILLYNLLLFLFSFNLCNLL